jgi:hypothetical protein
MAKSPQFGDGLSGPCDGDRLATRGTIHDFPSVIAQISNADLAHG